MPKQFDEMLKSIKASLAGKNNPRTKKPYSESDIYAIAVAAWKKKHGSAPSREMSPSWYAENGKEVRENVNISWDNLIELSQKVGPSSLNTQPLVIEGMAINETITKNNIKYVSEELERSASTLIGKPILNSHNNESIDSVLGKILEAKKVDGGIWYKAEIDPEEKKVINKIKKGYINKVSIGAHVNELVKENYEENGVLKECFLAKGLSFSELSLVSTPGDENTSISLSQAIGESFSDDKNVAELEIKFDETKEENQMVEEVKNELKEQLASSEKTIAELSAKLKSFEAEKAKVEEEAKMKILREQIKKELIEELKPKAEEPKKEEPKADESKGKVEASEEPKKDEKAEELAKKYVCERSREGVSFYFL